MSVFKKPKHKETMFGSKPLLKTVHDKSSPQKAQYNSMNSSSQYKDAYNQIDGHKFKQIDISNPNETLTKLKTEVETIASLSTSSSSSTNDSVMLNSNCSSDEGFSEYCKNISNYDESNYYQYNNYMYHQNQSHQYNMPYLMEHSPPPSINFSSFNKTHNGPNLPLVQQDSQQFMQINSISVQPSDVASPSLNASASNAYILNLNEFKANTSNQTSPSSSIYKASFNQDFDINNNNTNNKSIINTPTYLRANEFSQIDSSGLAVNDAINLQYSRYNNSNLNTMTSNYQNNCSINSNYNSNSSTPCTYYYNSHHYYNANPNSIEAKTTSSTSNHSNLNFNHFNQTNTSTNNY